MSEEVKEVEVLTEEQINKMPVEAHEPITFLIENENPKELAVFNPLVSRLLELNELSESLTYKGKDENDSFDKANIQEFIDVQKDVKSYRAGLKKTCKALKDPHIIINKKYNAVQDAFLEKANILFDSNEEKFAEYRQWQEDEKKRKEDAKNAALLEAKDKAESEAEEAKKSIERTNVYNAVKYDLIQEKLVNDVQTNVVQSNLQTLQNMKAQLEDLVYEDLVKGQNLSVLDDELKAELHELFISKKQTALALLNKTIENIQTERDKDVLEAKVDALKDGAAKIDEAIPPAVPAPPGAVPQINYDELNDEEFAAKIVGNLELLLTLINNRIEKKPQSSPAIYSLRNSINEIL